MLGWFFRSAFAYTEGPGSAGAKYCVPLRPGRMAATVRCAVRPLESGRLHRPGLALTFRQALALGGHVRKGEKGTTVVYADPSALWLASAAGPRVAGDPELIPFRQPSFDLEISAFALHWVAICRAR